MFNEETFERKLQILAAGYKKRYGDLLEYDVEDGEFSLLWSRDLIYLALYEMLDSYWRISCAVEIERFKTYRPEIAVSSLKPRICD